MDRYLRILLAGIAALAAMAALSACGSGTSTESADQTTTPPPVVAPAFPQSAQFIADMKAFDGKTMTIGIAVDNGEIAAYACNGTDDEAWFFGNATDGTIDITSRFRDKLTARLDGRDITGDVTMNGVTYPFTATPVSGDAGIYTADADGARATWLVRPDGSAIGVQFNGISGRDFEQAELQQLNDLQFRNEVRNKRQLQQAQQIQRLANGRMSSRINNREVTPVLVTGNFRLG
ncbi:hypothetical protein [Mycolicibacterium phlei]